MFGLFKWKTKHVGKIVDKLKYAGIFPDEIKEVVVYINEYGAGEHILSKKFRHKSIWFAVRIISEEALLTISQGIKYWYESEQNAGSCVDHINNAYKEVDDKYQFYPLISNEEVHLDYFYDGNVIIRNLVANAVNELEDKAKIQTFKKDYYDNLKTTGTEEYEIVTVALENNFSKDD